MRSYDFRKISSVPKREDSIVLTIENKKNLLANMVGGWVLEKLTFI